MLIKKFSHAPLTGYEKLLQHFFLFINLRNVVRTKPPTIITKCCTRTYFRALPTFATTPLCFKERKLISAHLLSRGVKLSPFFPSRFLSCSNTSMLTSISSMPLCDWLIDISLYCSLWQVQYTHNHTSSTVFKPLKSCALSSQTQIDLVTLSPHFYGPSLPFDCGPV